MNTFRDTLRKIAPIVGNEKVNSLWRVYLNSSSDDQKELERNLEAQAVHLLNEDAAGTPAGLFPPPPPETCLGTYDIGTVKYGGCPPFLFGLRSDELIKHVGVYGASGSGKSNVLALLVDGLMRERVPFILFDFKSSLRSMLKDYKDLLVFTAGDSSCAPFQFNPLIPPPNVQLEVFAKKVVGSALAHSYVLGAGANAILNEVIMEAYADARNHGQWPTFVDIWERLERIPTKGRKGMWLDSAKRAVRSLSSGGMANVFCPSRSIDLAKVLQRPVIIELEQLDQAEKTFFSEAFFLWVIFYYMRNVSVRERLNGVIILEEAHNLMAHSPGMGDGSEPVLTTVLREIRELGISIIIATQNASIVPLPIFANQATTIALQNKHSSDVRAVAQALLLKDEAKDMLSRIPVGEALVRCARSSAPIHVSITHRPIQKGTITNDNIRDHMRPYFTDSAFLYPAQTKPKLFRGIPSSDEEQNKPKESPTQEVPTFQTVVTATPTTTPKEGERQPVLGEPSPLERAMLTDIVTAPFDGVVRRIHRLQTSRRKGVAALQALEQRGVITPVNIFTGSSILKLFDLTKEGRDVCTRQRVGPLPKVTEGGIEHRYAVNDAANRLIAEQWSVTTEHRVSNDLVVDIHAVKDGRTIAVLVETGKSDIKRNVTRTKLAGYDEVRVIPSHRRKPILNSAHFEQTS